MFPVHPDELAFVPTTVVGVLDANVCRFPGDRVVVLPNVDMFLDGVDREGLTAEIRSATVVVAPVDQLEGAVGEKEVLIDDPANATDRVRALPFLVGLTARVEPEVGGRIAIE